MALKHAASHGPIPPVPRTYPRVEPKVAPVLFGVLDQLDGQYVKVRPERCVAVRNRNATCRACAAACTSGAIVLDEKTGGLHVDASRCVGCGTCATACPTCAVESRSPTDRELLERCRAAADANGVVAVACGHAVRTGTGGSAVAVGCLGRVDESLLVGLAAAGLRGVVLKSAACDACAMRPGRRVADAVIATSRELLAAWGSDFFVELAEGPVGNEGAGCREWEVHDEPARTRAVSHMPPLKAGADGTLPHFVPDRRERLLDALACLGTPDGEKTLVTRLWATVYIDPERCTSCRSCAVFCPTGALIKFDEPNGLFGIDHFSGECVRCSSCVDVCPHAAVSLCDEVASNVLLGGGVERHYMAARPRRVGSSYAILDSMRAIIKNVPVFER